ncbi:DUF1990 family protein, partial [Flavonifractor plautii]|uniref:DUF1990 family protein n=1 Tax=Flavonifractor plautii TaxID=292800 RepID=UPI003D7D112B
MPQGYICDHRRTKLGTGLEVFQAGIDAINQWQMFNLGWVTIYGAGQPQAGLNVCVLAH